MKILCADYVLPITQDPIYQGAVTVENDRIVAVGEQKVLAKRFPDSERKDFIGAVLMPGLVNCHSHLELTILRGFLDRFDGDFAAWLIALTKTRAEQLSNNDLRISAKIGALEGIRAGVTCFADIGRFGEAGLDALIETGLRGIIYQETEFSPDDDEAEADFRNLVQRYQNLNERKTTRVEIGISPHASYTLSRKQFVKIAEFSIKNDVPLTIHAAESEEEELFIRSGKGLFDELFQKLNLPRVARNCSSIEYLAEAGVLNAKPLLAHCIHVSDRDLKLIAQSGSRIAHCPKSNAKFGHGIAPFSRFVNNGISTGLGSDSMASNNTCDLFEEGRFAALLSRTVNDKSGFVDARQIINIATAGGAKALGLEKEIGTLEIGKQADIIAVSMNHFAQNPVYDPYSALVFTTNSRDVVFSMVAGRVLYENGSLTGFDESRVLEEFQAMSDKLRYDRGLGF